MEFVEEIKENGFEISIEKNPIFYDEPDKEDIDNGTFDEAELPINSEPVPPISLEGTGSPTH